MLLSLFLLLEVGPDPIYESLCSLDLPREGGGEGGEEGSLTLLSILKSSLTFPRGQKKLVLLYLLKFYI